MHNYRFNASPDPDPNFIFGLFLWLWSLGSSKRHTGLLGSFSMNICREAKNRIFFNGGYWSSLAKNDKILKSSFFTRFCPQGTRRVGNISGHTDSFASLSMNILSGGQKSSFFRWGILAIWPKMTKFWRRYFSLVFVHRELAVSENSLFLCWWYKNWIFSNARVGGIGSKWPNF